MNAGKLRYPIELWHNVKVENEVKAKSNKLEIFKTIWCDVIPQTGKMVNYQADTIISKCTHKIIMRYLAGKDISTDMWFMYRGHRLNISYIPENFRGDVLEIFCEEVVE